MSTGFERRDLLRLGGLIAALLAVVAVVVIAGGGGEGSSQPASGRVDGVLTEVTQTRLVLQPARGGEAMEFAIRPEDVRTLDLFHLQQHAADALPSIVHFESEGDTRYAVRVDDGPVPGR